MTIESIATLPRHTEAGLAPEKPRLPNKPRLDAEDLAPLPEKQARHSRRDLERVLLRPTVLSPEERLKQVISLEDIKQLLMIARPGPRDDGIGQFVNMQA